MRVCQKCGTMYGVGSDYLCAKCRIEIHPYGPQTNEELEEAYALAYKIQASIDSMKEPHHDTRRLDWLLRYISFNTFSDNGKRYTHVCIEPPAELDLRLRLEKAWRQIDSDDPRKIIDKAMEVDNGNP